MARDRNPWIDAEITAIDTRPSSGLFALLKTDHGTDLRIDDTRYRLDAGVMMSIARLAAIDEVVDGTGAFVRIRLDDDGFVREIADIDGGKPLAIQPHYEGMRREG